METKIDYEFAKKVMESVHTDYHNLLFTIECKLIEELSDIRCDKVDFLRGKLSLIREIRNNSIHTNTEYIPF